MSTAIVILGICMTIIPIWYIRFIAVLLIIIPIIYEDNRGKNGERMRSR